MCVCESVAYKQQIRTIYPYKYVQLNYLEQHYFHNKTISFLDIGSHLLFRASDTSIIH